MEGARAGGRRECVCGGGDRKIGHFFANMTNVWPQMALTVMKVFYKKLKKKDYNLTEIKGFF